MTIIIIVSNDLSEKCLTFDELWLVCLLLIYQTKLGAIALVILTIQQNEGYCDDDGGCVELDCDADVLVVMMFPAIDFNTDTDDDDDDDDDDDNHRCQLGRGNVTFHVFGLGAKKIHGRGEKIHGLGEKIHGRKKLRFSDF